ncbi:fumarylacetoacetase [Dactylosporangium maewongense]|uniref:fumarylacetoacetase n=1 Tax=Dactylosporangium maewongense TaxID=634393 RepID=A0ABP4NRV1_9ACTN
MTWLDLPADTTFGIHNLPYGIFSTAPHGHDRRIGVAIGPYVLDIAALAADLRLHVADIFAEQTLNRFMAQGPTTWSEVRQRITDWLVSPAHRAAVLPHLIRRDNVQLHLPVSVADYVDFYASQHHAENLGRIFRPDSAPLTPNWKHLPIGYHGRAGTIVVSGTDVVRPCGQRKALAASEPAFGPSQRLDIEAEVGFLVGTPSKLGAPVPVTDFATHVFGVCLVNDWSARDIQSWEYVPLGPFLGKSFATSISPWIVPLDALQHARVQPPPRDPAPLPYLRDVEPWALDITLEVRLNGQLISRPPYAAMYWTPAQMLAHMTAGGASLRTGDLYASGTVSGSATNQRGSLIELSWGGTEPLTLPDGTQRTFLLDGDEVTLTANAPGPHGRTIGFGEVRGRIVSSVSA